MKFGAVWCGPCRLLDISLVKIKKENSLVKITNIDVDEHPELAKEFNIKSVPTIIFTRENIEVLRFVGNIKIDALRAAIRDFLPAQHPPDHHPYPSQHHPDL
jgi:thioredoxin 1